MRHLSGFSLVELSIVTLVIALLVGSILVPLGKRQRIKENEQAERYLREVEEALIGFAVANGRLPWPDTDVPPDGVENAAPPIPPSCTTCEGLLPWRTIGTLATDPWGRICRYRVTHEFASPARTGLPPAPNRFDLFDRGDVRVNARVAHSTKGIGGASVGDIVLTDDAAAAVASAGRNGAGGRRLDGTALVAPPEHTDESVNADGLDTDPPTPHFYARSVAAASPFVCSVPAQASRHCEFDDLVIWIPSAVLMKRMVDAGRLP